MYHMYLFDLTFENKWAFNNSFSLKNILRGILVFYQPKNVLCCLPSGLHVAHGPVLPRPDLHNGYKINHSKFNKKKNIFLEC